MLELKEVSLRINGVSDAEGVPSLLSSVTTTCQRGEFVAIIGPSGCGKSTLLKVIAGVAQGEESGEIFWDGRNLSTEDFAPSEIGYVPQFSIAHEELTVAECVGFSARLRVRGWSGKSLPAEVERLLLEVGLEEFAQREVKVLSGGQRRRLALAMELVSSPPILLCDEVTSGLDPQSEEEIVELLRSMAQEGDRLVLSVTHSLRHLDSYDAVLVLYRGVIAYAGPAQHLAHYFRVEDPSALYRQLETRTPEEWQHSWEKHGEAITGGKRGSLHPSAENLRPAPAPFTTIIVKNCPSCAAENPATSIYCQACGSRLPQEVKEVSKALVSVAALPQETDSALPSLEIAQESTQEFGEQRESETKRPDAISQLVTLVDRRLRIFWRNHAQLWLQAGLIFGFPCLVAVFAWNGLPQIRNLSMGLDLNVVQQLTEARDFLIQASKVGSLVSGIVMFEVILLTLMGANNSGREIAGERAIFEKEKLAGLRPASYVASKVLFLGILSAVQSLWMGCFIHYVCGFPGYLGGQLLFLFLVNAAMTAVCLAISSLLGTAEQASLASIYLVGFQLPLSGAVLALPSFLGLMVRPFIAAYWSWSGVLQTLRGERYYDIVQMVIQTGLSSMPLCLWILLLHIMVGILVAWVGCQQSRLQ